MADLRHKRQQAHAALVKARAVHAMHAQRGVFNVSPWPLLLGVMAATTAMLFVIFMLWRERHKAPLKHDGQPPTPTAHEELWIELDEAPR